MTWGCDHLSVAYGRRSALHDISVRIVPGVVHAVIGGDGAGKSTLLKVLVGLDVGQTGSVNLPERKHIGYLPSAGGVFDDLSVDENLEFVASVYRLDDWRHRARFLLDHAGIGSVGSRLAGTLSGGQRRKLAACMALLPGPRLLVLDEITTGVDPRSRMELWRLVAGAAAGGAAVVVATTYLDEAERAGAVWLLHRGRLLAAGSAGDLIAAVPGTVAVRTAPENLERAWRSGRSWKEWLPGAPPGGAVSLEDAAIVYELQQNDGRP